ncbi:threonine/serine exporter family protein [Mycobacterium sp. RTGN5]|uniref:threonine/serine exporter family protein n=1 Tax=Mycobacterium sp. RTGN5 TaxID=3016522 RepID=UPI0029C7D000|nr:threonine/serine exporter family protein [Mycobacterium sp. RTGN5]
MSDVSLDRDLALRAATLLYDNGQSTQMVLVAVDRINQGLGSRTTVVPSWASLLAVPDDTATPVRVAPVSPVGVNMRRVATAMRAIDRAEDGPLDRAGLDRELTIAASETFSGTVAFVTACAAGAAALAVVFGIDEVRAILLAAASAAVGGVLRRVLGRFSAGPLAQAFAAAMAAGAVGALAMHLNIGAAALVTVCPAMVLVPGPHVLNGAMDLLGLRITLGIARLGYAALVLAAIAAGLILGLRLGGNTLPVTGAAAAVPLAADVLAAGVAAACYPVYFSMPYRMIGWPIAAGMAGHALHWWASTVWHLSLASSAFLACLLVGTALTPISHKLRIPFAAIGFAAVVSLVPGVFVFRTLSGLAQLPASANPELVAATMSNAATAALVVTAMALGLVIPIHIRDALLRRQAR